MRGEMEGSHRDPSGEAQGQEAWGWQQNGVGFPRTQLSEAKHTNEVPKGRPGPGYSGVRWASGLLWGFREGFLQELAPELAGRWGGVRRSRLEGRPG